MMACIPAPARTTHAADAFTFSGAPDVAARTYENVETLWMAPWRAYWALTFEALDKRNWR